MWKLKLPEGKDRWIFLLTVGVILCILAFPVGSKSSRGTLPLSRMEAENVTASAPGSQDAAAYEQKLEKRVREILRGVSGVGEVDVMIGTGEDAGYPRQDGKTPWSFTVA